MIRHFNTSMYRKTLQSTPLQNMMEIYNCHLQFNQTPRMYETYEDHINPSKVQDLAHFIQIGQNHSMMI